MIRRQLQKTSGSLKINASGRGPTVFFHTKLTNPNASASAWFLALDIYVKGQQDGNDYRNDNIEMRVKDNYLNHEIKICCWKRREITGT
jgi:hypothetical protein